MAISLNTLAKLFMSKTIWKRKNNVFGPKGYTAAKIYRTIGFCLSRSTNFFLKALVRRKKSRRIPSTFWGVSDPPRALWKSRLERWEQKEGRDALSEMPGKTFWSGDARDFEAPIELLAWIQVMVFPSPQLSAARVFQQREKGKVVGEREEQLPVHFSAAERVRRAKHWRLMLTEGLALPWSTPRGLLGVSRLA